MGYVDKDDFFKLMGELGLLPENKNKIPENDLEEDY